MLCYNFNCPHRIPVNDGDFKVVDTYSVSIAGWHAGQVVTARIYLVFCSDACALHYLDTDAQGEDRQGVVKTPLEVLESVCLAHQKWCLSHKGDKRRFPAEGKGDGSEPDYEAISLPRQADGLVVVSRIRVPTTWTKGSSFAAIEFIFDSTVTRAEFSRRLVTTDEKLSFLLQRARQHAQPANA